MKTAPIPVIVIAGPTGAGKSALAVAVAQALDGVIINADSRQVYADFPIITAQPDTSDLASVPHSLYGFLPCHEKLSAGMYADMAAKEIDAVREKGKCPVLVGGTGLYLQTLLQGIAPIPPVAPAVSAQWQARLAAEGAPALHALLSRRDPQTAARLHPNDSQRIVRALEVLEGTGKPLGYWHALPLPPARYAALQLHTAMSLSTLEPRLEKRIDIMLEKGALEEARAAYALCSKPDAPGWSGIGCAELFSVLTGKTSLAESKTAWIHNTRTYAKRQITWFKRDKNLVTVDPEDIHSATALCRKFYQVV